MEEVLDRALTAAQIQVVVEVRLDMHKQVEQDHKDLMVRRMEGRTEEVVVVVSEVPV
jgi:sporulation-control protein spo0M